ncbi:MAG: hypothetical protein MUF15_09855 [Acidobacteria bacterium]|nr:hypothetical protein [Acidobacteriota bacterium]
MTNQNLNAKPFPKGSYINNLHKGEGVYSNTVYASLRGPDGELLISADLEYIQKRIIQVGFEK